MPTRPTEKQLFFPLLNIIYDPLAQHTVLFTMPMDWGNTGVCDLRYTSVDSLRDFNRVLQHAQNYIADELLEAEKAIKAEVKTQKKSSPF